MVLHRLAVPGALRSFTRVQGTAVCSKENTIDDARASRATNAGDDESGPAAVNADGTAPACGPSHSAAAGHADVLTTTPTSTTVETLANLSSLSLDSHMLPREPSFEFDTIKDPDKDVISRTDLRSFISEQPQWLRRFGTPDADDLFRRIGRKHNGTISKAEFGQWVEFFPRAAQPAGLSMCTSFGCQRVSAKDDDACCLMCQTSHGTAGHDMCCTGVARAPAGCIFEKERSRDTGAKLVDCSLRVGQQVVSLDEMRFGGGKIVEQGDTGVVVERDDGIIIDWDADGLRGKHCRTFSYLIRAAQEHDPALSEEPGPAPQWVLSVKYHGEYDDRKYREQHDYFDDAYLFGGASTWPELITQAVQGHFNPNTKAQLRCSSDCLGRETQCTQFRLCSSGAPAAACCAVSRWRWHVREKGHVLRVIEECGESPEQEVHQEVLEDLVAEGHHIEVRTVHLRGPVEFVYQQSKNFMGGGSTCRFKWNTTMLKGLFERCGVPVANSLR